MNRIIVVERLDGIEYLLSVKQFFTAAGKTEKSLIAFAKKNKVFQVRCHFMDGSFDNWIVKAEL